MRGPRNVLGSAPAARAARRRKGGSMGGGWRRAGSSDSSEVISAVIASIAAVYRSATAAGGLGTPDTLRTNCSAAARISTLVAGGSSPRSSVMFRHMSARYRFACTGRPGDLDGLSAPATVFVGRDCGREVRPCRRTHRSGDCVDPVAAQAVLRKVRGLCADRCVVDRHGVRHPHVADAPPFGVHRSL